ncbi:DNA polymerase III subunit gamma/tau [Corallococcus terminator]|uniref:DNA polymerase III subunit gamma/tau n=1 Tax=Corallococcus terminator TaxID=2316733 RepID=A0A3A8HCU9_9BACT|nr:DNA polymerase III subunit gamma/tau [Corallococcus terminator]
MRITNMRRPEPEGPPEPQPYDDETDERLFPEEGSAEGCASGECLPSDGPTAFTPAPTEPTQSDSAPTSTAAAFTEQHAASAPASDTFTTLTPAPNAFASTPAFTASPAPALNAFAPAPAAFTEQPAAPTPAPAALTPAPTTFAPPPPAPTPAPAAFAPPPAEVAPPSAVRASPAAFTPPSPVRAPPPTFTPPPAAFEPEPPEPEPPPASAPVASGRDNPNRSLPERWRAAVDSVKATSVRHGTALANGRLVSMKAGEIVLGFPPTAAFHKAAVTAAAGKATVDAALASHFGRPVKLTIQDVAQAQEAHSLGMSISEQDSHSRATHEKSTEGKVRSHASVRSILKMLGGEIEHIQVYEPERPPAVLTDMPTTPDD